MTRDEILAMPEGRELDALVAERVMGKPFRRPTHGSCCTCQNCGEDYDSCGGGCFYSADIAAAWQVVEKLRERLNVEIQTANHLVTKEQWRVVVDDTDFGCIHHGIGEVRTTKDISVFGNTAPLAICRAALLMTLEANP